MISEFVMPGSYLVFVTLAGLAASVASYAAAADMATSYQPSGGAEDLAYDWSGIYARVQGGVQSKGVPNPFSSRSGWRSAARSARTSRPGRWSMAASSTPPIRRAPISGSATVPDSSRR